MTPASAPDPATPALPSAGLHVRAGGVVLEVPWELLVETGAAGPVTPLPGAPPWLAGLAQWKGRLVSVVDAGSLFGRQAGSRKWLLALRGLACEVTLGVDELIGPPRPGEPAEVRLAAAELAAHPAFQPGAAGPAAGGTA